MTTKRHRIMYTKVYKNKHVLTLVTVKAEFLKSDNHKIHTQKQQWQKDASPNMRVNKISHAVHILFEFCRKKGVSTWFCIILLRRKLDLNLLKALCNRITCTSCARAAPAQVACAAAASTWMRAGWLAGHVSARGMRT